MTRSMRSAALALLFALSTLLLGGCGGGGGSSATIAQPPDTPPTAYTDPTLYSSGAGASVAVANEATAVTHFQTSIGGLAIPYTATTGHLTANRLATEAPLASFFYVAYTADNKDLTKRPVTFFYNGGPGSSTVWLHLGSFGPKRLAASAPSTTTPVPFPLVDNVESLLDVSDLVFVDAVGSGLSQAIAPNTNRSFWGVDADAAVFRDFVRRYVKVNGRDASPKFLFGESYGTTRSAVLANLLESSGVSLSGVVLQSSVLNYNTNCEQNPLPVVRCSGFMPSYGAVGAWFSLTTPTPTVAALPAYVGTLRTLATNELDPAQQAFLLSGTLPSNDLLTRLAAATGIASARWQAQFNMKPSYFQANLIAGQLIGRYDGRVSAPVGSQLASEGDPSNTFITSSFVSTIASYLPNTLKYSNPSNYTTLSNAINSWDFTHDGLALPDTIPDLAAAFAHNPKLKVLSLNGYHDLATPFHQTELDIARLGVNPNVQSKFYSGGHMTYLDDASRVQQKADLAQFYKSALAQ